MDHWRDQSEKPLEIKEICYGGEPYQPHPGTRCHRCGCSLPGLTGFTADRCEGTGSPRKSWLPAIIAHHTAFKLDAIL